VQVFAEKLFWMTVVDNFFDVMKGRENDSDI
jgi:hypothetical protein